MYCLGAKRNGLLLLRIMVPIPEDRGGKKFFVFPFFFPEGRLLTTSTSLLPCPASWHKLQGAILAASDRSLPGRVEMKYTLWD